MGEKGRRERLGGRRAVLTKSASSADRRRSTSIIASNIVAHAHGNSLKDYSEMVNTRIEANQGGARYIIIEPGTGPKPPKKLKPARKQVAPNQVEKKEPEQTGKEYSE